MWPLTRRNCLPASIIPAAHQRSVICPSRWRRRRAYEQWLLDGDADLSDLLRACFALLDLGLGRL